LTQRLTTENPFESFGLIHERIKAEAMTHNDAIMPSVLPRYMDAESPAKPYNKLNMISFLIFSF
jgi:hypothetical protein